MEKNVSKTKELENQIKEMQKLNNQLHEKIHLLEDDKKK